MYAKKCKTDATLPKAERELYLQFSYGQVPRFWLIYHLLHAEFAAYKLPLLIVWERAMKFRVYSRSEHNLVSVIWNSSTIPLLNKACWCAIELQQWYTSICSFFYVLIFSFAYALEVLFHVENPFVSSMFAISFSISFFTHATGNIGYTAGNSTDSRNRSFDFK